MPDAMPFSGNPLDRAGNLRQDAAWVEAQLAAPSSRFLLYHRLNVLTHHSDAPGLAWLDSTEARHLCPDAEPVLLGVRDGIAHFALDASATDDPIFGVDGAAFAEVRGIATELPPFEAGIVAHGRALVDWHSRHRFCPRCGAPTSVAKAGSARKCASCGAEHFPRTDPVVIMVVWRDDRCLLGRRAGRPGGAFSTLAGFIDQGETIEEAVRREVEEEVGVTVDEVVYHASQPWPFPSNLMIGCFAHATHDDPKVDELEIAEARWFTREEMRDVLYGPNAEGIVLPGPIAISYHLIKDWTDAPTHDPEPRGQAPPYAATPGK